MDVPGCLLHGLSQVVLVSLVIPECFLFMSSCRDSRLRPKGFLHYGPGPSSAFAEPQHHGAAVQTPAQVRLLPCHVALWVTALLTTPSLPLPPQGDPAQGVQSDVGSEPCDCVWTHIAAPTSGVPQHDNPHGLSKSDRGAYSQRIPERLPCARFLSLSAPHFPGLKTTFLTRTLTSPSPHELNLSQR